MISKQYPEFNILQSNEYYPFGLLTQNSWTRDNTSNNLLYDAGNELNTTTGLYDLPFRNYDAALKLLVKNTNNGRAFATQVISFNLRCQCRHKHRSLCAIGQARGECRPTNSIDNISAKAIDSFLRRFLL